MSNKKREQAVEQWKQSGGLADEYKFILKVSLAIMSSACFAQLIMLKIADQYIFTYLPYTILPLFVIAFGFLLPPRKYLAESMMLLIQWSTLAAYSYLFFVKTDHYYREAVGQSVSLIFISSLLMTRKFKVTFLLGAAGNIMLYLYLYSSGVKDQAAFLTAIQLILGQLIFLIVYRFNWNNFADYLILNEEIAQVERYNVELENRIIKEKEEIFEKTLTSVVPKRLKRRITDHIVGKEKFREYGDVIILFTKINNFKSILKSMPIEESSKLIESYMNITASFPRNYDGQLDKHIGEVSMVVFGVKSICDESLARSVLSYVKQVNELMQTQHSISLSHGISYGRSLYGVFGSADSRCAFTVFSNYVNEAARLIQVADDQSVLISESFAKEFSGINLHKFKTIHLKGLGDRDVYTY